MSVRPARAARLLLLLLAGVPSLALGGVDRVFLDGFEPPPGLPEVQFMRVGSDGPVGQGSDLALSWIAEAGASCSASSIPVNLFAGPQPSESPAYRVSTSGTGLHEYRLTCSNNVGSVIRSVVVDVQAAPAQAPTVGLSIGSSSFSDFEGPAAGWSETVYWQSTGATQCEASESGPATADWTGARALSGNAKVYPNRAGVYGLRLTCSNEQGVRSITRHFSVQDVPGCDDPLIRPVGWKVDVREWSYSFGNPNYFPTYPNGGPAPLGARRGGVTAIRFHAIANSAVMIDWQRVGVLPGYPFPLPASAMFFSISPCYGDLRPSVPGTPADPFLSEQCRGYGQSGLLVHATVTTSGTYCRLQPNEVYYLNVAPVDPSDGLTPGEERCEDPAHTRCDVQATQSGYYQPG
jgi:hypothetical protein